MYINLPLHHRVTDTVNFFQEQRMFPFYLTSLYLLLHTQTHIKGFCVCEVKVWSSELWWFEVVWNLTTSTCLYQLLYVLQYAFLCFPLTVSVWSLGHQSFRIFWLISRNQWKKEGTLHHDSSILGARFWCQSIVAEIVSFRISSIDKHLTHITVFIILTECVYRAHYTSVLQCTGLEESSSPLCTDGLSVWP